MKHFKMSEFACPCCGESEMSSDFIADLNFAREIAETPFVITSGYRCQNHNAVVGGVASSSHTRGCAVDIKADNSRHRFLIINSLLQAGFTRLGIADTFIHVDSDGLKDKEVIWTYGR